jgi:hypothetical protein
MKKDIVLNVSALTAALSCLAATQQTTDGTTAPKIKVSHAVSQHQRPIDDIMANVAIHRRLRMTQSTIMPAVEVSKDEMESVWLRLAQLDIKTDVKNGIITDGLENGIGRLVGPNSDSTLADRLTESSEMAGCYSNCHAACHGSRGWR